MVTKPRSGLLLSIKALTCMIMASNASANFPPGDYQLKALHSGRCIDVQDTSRNVGANVQQWLCTGTAHRQWSADQNADSSYTIVASHSGKTLDVQGVSTSNGANMFQ